MEKMTFAKATARRSLKMLNGWNPIVPETIMRKVCFIECRIVMPMLIINSYVLLCMVLDI